MWCISNSVTPPVLTFDHRPTDEELRVPQPFRNPTGNVRLRKEPEAWTISESRLPLWVMLTFSLVMLGAIITIAVENWRDGMIRTIMPILSVIAALMASAMWSADRAVARQGPLVTYRRDRGELQIEGRTEPLNAADVTEIVELTLPDPGWGVGKRDGHFALYLIVHERDGVYSAERLYHGQPSGRATWDVAPQLAKELGVGYRRIELEHPDPILSPFWNTKPPKPLSEITRG